MHLIGSHIQPIKSEIDGTYITEQSSSAGPGIY